MQVEILSEKTKEKEILPQVVNRIFSICKTDPHFKLKNEVEVVEEKLRLLKEKIEKQEDLLKQSTQLTESVTRRIKLIQEENQTKQTELLETLGSEL